MVGNVTHQEVSLPVDPLVSAVIPTYGREPEFLREAVDSVREQTYEAIELVVVDDSPEEVSAFVEDDPGFRTVRRVLGRDHNGVGGARNSGIDASTGDLIAFLDDDDRWMPTKVERQVETLRTAPPGTGAVVTGQRFFVDGSPTGARSPATRGDVTRDMLLGASLCPPSTAMVRRELVGEDGVRFDDDLPYWEDRDWYIRLSRHCDIAVIDDPLIARRYGDYGQMKDAFDEIRDEAYPMYVRKHRPLAVEYGIERKFEASAASMFTNVAVGNGRHGDARRAALRSLRADPTAFHRYPDLLVAIGGRRVFRAAQFVHRRIPYLANN